MSEEIFVSDRDGVRRVVIDRPEKRNALTRDMMSDLADAFRGAEYDATVRAILLQSNGPLFCAGADLEGLASGPLNETNDPGYEFFQRLAQSTKPLICAVQGHAVGMGVTMLLHFDLVFAVPEATFQTPFSDLGLTPEGGASFLLPATMGGARAALLLMLGEAMTAAEAQSGGLISQLVDSGKLHGRAHSAAISLAKKPPRALAQTKKMMRDGRLIDQLNEEQRIFRQHMLMDEFKQAIEILRQRISEKARGSKQDQAKNRLATLESVRKQSFWGLY